MAVNEKAYYSLGWQTNNGKTFLPGQQVSGHVPEAALRSAMERGLVTDSHAAAERAAKGEQERRADVEHQIQTRSERRDGKPV